MMVLRSSPTSPFGRKVKIAAHELGLFDRLSVQLADTLSPTDDLRRQNPLGKIPALVLADGSTLYDSRVIMEYFDALAGGGRLTPVGLERFPVLVRHALADGLMDAGILQIYEQRFRQPEQRSTTWVDHQVGKVERALDALEATAEPLKLPVNGADIAVACALGYLDLRFGGAWRATHPRLVTWLAAFEAHVPSFDKTRSPPV
jgi:glutathione S-transferase